MNQREDIARQDCDIAVFLRVGQFDKRAAICIRLLAIRFKLHGHVAFAAHHLSLLGVMMIAILVAGSATGKSNVRGSTAGALNGDPHLISRRTDLEQMKVSRTQLARFQMKITTLAHNDYRDVALLGQLHPILPDRDEGAEQEEE